MHTRKRVALLIEPDAAYTRGLIRGVMSYVREHQPWSIYHGPYSRGEVSLDSLKSWSGDGIIARVDSAAVARSLRKTKLPVVDVSGLGRWPDGPSVHSDDLKIGQLAADHLLSRGFRTLAYCGDRDRRWSLERGSAFQRAVEQAGGRCLMYRPARATGSISRWTHDATQLLAWVKELPKPIGILAAWDGYAEQILEACRCANLSVPEEIAVLGVDDDDLVCELAEPPLSSVMLDPRRAGFLAADLLNRAMAGERLTAEDHRVDPLGVATRQSTDVRAIGDASIAEAVRLIRERACTGISVATVLESVAMSRKSLEVGFRRWLGRSPHQEILRVKLHRVRQLLLETDLSLAEIAGLAGFDHAEYLSVVFKREYRVTPGQFRARQAR